MSSINGPASLYLAGAAGRAAATVNRPLAASYQAWTAKGGGGSDTSYEVFSGKL